MDLSIVSISLGTVIGQDLSMYPNQSQSTTYLAVSKKEILTLLFGLKPEGMLGLELQATSCCHVTLDAEANITEGRVKRWRETNS